IGISRFNACFPNSVRKEISMLPMLAQAAQWVLVGDKGLRILALAIGNCIVVLGAAKGIGHIAGSAMEGIARQPEAGGRIGTNRIIPAAVVERLTFLALGFCRVG